MFRGTAVVGRSRLLSLGTTSIVPPDPPASAEYGRGASPLPSAIGTLWRAEYGRGAPAPPRGSPAVWGSGGALCGTSARLSFSFPEGGRLPGMSTRRCEKFCGRKSHP